MLKLDPTVPTDKVSTQGYSRSDLNTYYSSTFLLNKLGGGGFQVVYVEGIEEGNAIGYIFADEAIDRFSTPIDNLYRFTPASGFYQTSNSRIIKYNYVATRSYKKGLANSHVNIKALGKPIAVDTMGRLRLLTNMLTLTTFDNSKDFVVSRGLAVFRGKIYTTYKTKTVGSFKNNTVVTPFPAVVDRIREFNGEIKCQIQELPTQLEAGEENTEDQNYSSQEYLVQAMQSVSNSNSRVFRTPPIQTLNSGTRSQIDPSEIVDENS